MGKKAAVVSTGWLGDAIACTAAATSLAEKGYATKLYIAWPQLKPLLDNDNRFTTVLYGRYLNRKISRPLFPLMYDLVVREPKLWTYSEPFTAEIRRLAGCDPATEYRLTLSADQVALTGASFDRGRPAIAIARDSHKRAYGRDIDELVKSLADFADVRWVGLNPDKDSKKGKKVSLEKDASIIYHSDLFLGPEGGLLWVAAGVGTRCVYFSEYILDIDKHVKQGCPRAVLGAKYHFPGGPHLELPAYCTNEHIVQTIREILADRRESKS